MDAEFDPFYVLRVVASHWDAMAYFVGMTLSAYASDFIGGRMASKVAEARGVTKRDYMSEPGHGRNMKVWRDYTTETPKPWLHFVLVGAIGGGAANFALFLKLTGKI